MKQSFDRFPRKAPEREPGEFFELPPAVLRRKLPLITHDPSFPQMKLEVPQSARSLLGMAAQELGVAEDASEVALRLVLHFSMREPGARQALCDNVEWHHLTTVQPLSGIKLIDYGAAAGGFVKILRSLGAQAYGIDREDVRPTLQEVDAKRADDLLDERGRPVMVMGQERFHQPDTQQFLAGVDMVISSRLLRVVNCTPDHRRFMDSVTERLLKPGGLVMTIPALYDERLDDTDHYSDRYSQFDYRGRDDGWDYTIARKLK